jgi:pimeloyl-ACP methyl ester carboxylesterase
VNLYLLEYPGYGERSGTPSERSLVNAAVAAVDLLAERPTHSLWLLGESLGSGVASAAAGLRPHRVDGIVLVTPFDSLVGAAQFHYPWIPVGWLMRHRLDSTENLRAFPGPVAIVIAGEDRTTPPILGKKLAASIDSAVRIWEAPGAGHNDTDLLFRPWPEIARWLEESTLKAAR